MCSHCLQRRRLECGVSICIVLWLYRAQPLPVFCNPGELKVRHLTPLSDGGLYADHKTKHVCVCVHYKHQTRCIQSPGLQAAAHGCLAVVGEHLHCAVWAPCPVNVLITQPRRRPHFVSLHQLPPAVRKVLMPSGVSDSKNSRVTQNKPSIVFPQSNKQLCPNNIYINK